MSEYIFKPRCTYDFELDERDRTNPVDWYGTLHGEIVRCRDCAKADWFGAIGYGEFRCRVHGWTSESNDGFCAWGKRKEVRDD